MVGREECAPARRRSECAQSRVGLPLVQEAILAPVHADAVASNRWSAVTGQNGTNPALSKTVFLPWDAKVNVDGRSELLAVQVEVRIDFLFLEDSVAQVPDRRIVDNVQRRLRRE